MIEIAKLIMAGKTGLAVVSVIIAAILVLFGLNLSFTGKAAYVTSKINTTASLSISFTPINPKVSESMAISFTVTSTMKGDFQLETIVAENGATMKYRNYQFSLDSGDSNSFMLSYVPTDINQENIIANLYSGDKSVLYDSKTLDFKAHSDIGPFDIALDTPIDYIQTGSSVPFSVTMKNFGLKDVDANLTIDIFCNNAPEIERSQFIKINSSTDTEKDFILPSCNEPGQHMIKSALNVYGIEYVSSKSQFFEKDYLNSLDFLVPDVINAKANTTQELDVVYNNNNGFDLTDVAPIVFGVPSSWFSVIPDIVPEMKSGSSIVSIVHFNIPENSEGIYPLLIGMTGDNLFGEKVVQLRVTGGAVSQPAKIISEAPSLLLPMIILSIAIIVAFFLISRRKPKPTFSYKLSKIRREVTS